MVSNKLIKLTLCSALALGSLTVSACSNYAGNKTNKGVQPNASNYQMKSTNLDNNSLNFRRWENRGANDNTSMHNNTKMQMSKEIADKVSVMKGIDTANVMLTDHNAYVAVGLDAAGSNVSGKMKDEIARQVQSMDSSLDNVYVSANPDFVQHMKSYGTMVKEGRPIRGLIIEFNDMVGRIFPTAVSR